MTHRSSSKPPYPFHVPKDTVPTPSGPYPAVSQEHHTLSQRPPSQMPPTVEIRDLPPMTRVTMVQPVFPPQQEPPAPPTIKRDRPQFHNVTQFSHPTMLHPAMIPSFTGTTVTEAMRYDKPFLVRVWQSFRHSNIVLMAGGVAYNMLLSIIPMFALIFVVLSQFFERDLLIKTISTNLKVLIPGDPKFIDTQLDYFVNHPELFGGLTLIFLIFFSSLAFSMLENAMSVIFAYDKTRSKRRFWVSATLPYLYIICIFLGIMMLTGISTMLDKAPGKNVSLLGFTWSVAGSGSFILHIASFLGLGLMLSSLYMIMPKCPISLRRALIGGFVAATLWEITRRILVFYFTKISMVSAIYGPIGTVIVVLVSFEVAAIIVLFGAQVIAELQRAEIFRKIINGESGATR